MAAAELPAGSRAGVDTGWNVEPVTEFVVDDENNGGRRRVVGEPELLQPSVEFTSGDCIECTKGLVEQHHVCSDEVGAQQSESLTPPPLNCDGHASSNPASPNCSNSFRAGVRVWEGFLPATSPPIQVLSSARFHGSSRSRCAMYPTIPLGPTIETNDPTSTVREKSSNAIQVAASWRPSRRDRRRSDSRGTRRSLERVPRRVQALLPGGDRQRHRGSRWCRC
jgi:hypothetical protein